MYKRQDLLTELIFKYLPYGPQFYDEDTVTDQPMRQIASELIREKALRLLSDEIPHGIAVTIETVSYTHLDVYKRQMLTWRSTTFYAKKRKALSFADRRCLRMIDGILIGLAVLCAAYFVVIVVYAGIGTSFAFIWLFFAALLLFLVYGKWYYARNLDRIPGWVPVSVVTTCVAGVAVLAMLCVLVFLGAATSAKSNLDYVIVLGARVKERTVSNSCLLYTSRCV